MKVLLRGCQVVMLSQVIDEQKGYRLAETCIMPSQGWLPLHFKPSVAVLRNF